MDINRVNQLSGFVYSEIYSVMGNHLIKEGLISLISAASYLRAFSVAKNSLLLYNDDNLTEVQLLIVERTYCTKQSEEDCAFFIEKLPVLMENPILKPLFDGYALSLLSHWQAHITIFEDDHCLMLSFVDYGAFYHMMSRSINARSDIWKPKDLLSTLTHEIAHAVMDYLFPLNAELMLPELVVTCATDILTGNNFLTTMPAIPSSPYSALDPLAKARFEKTEKTTLINIYDFLDPWHQEVDPTISSWELGDKIYQDVYRKINNPTLSSFLGMFKYYSQIYNHVEFIVGYYQAAALGEDATIMNLLEPIADYVREEINPIIENKLNNYMGAFHFPTDANGNYVTNAPVIEMTNNNKLAFSLAERNYEDVAKIIKQGVEQKYFDHYITLAEKKGEQAALAVLLKAAESAHMKVEGRNPLGWAIKHEHFDIAKEMINKGADFKSENIMGYTAYDWAVKHCYIDFADFLIDHDNKKLTLSSSLAERNYEDVARIIKQGVEGKYLDCHITIAEKKGEQVALAVLLKAAESAHMKVEGWNPLGWAIKHEHFDIAKEMINKGADFKSENIMGYTAYDWAVKHCYIDFADFLIDHDNDLSYVQLLWNKVYVAATC